MSGDARLALQRLVAALEMHFEAVIARRSDSDPSVESAYGKLADAFEVYDNALLDEHDETTPLVLFDEDDLDDDELDELDGLLDQDLQEMDELDDTEFIDLGTVDSDDDVSSGPRPSSSSHS